MVALCFCCRNPKDRIKIESALVRSRKNRPNTDIDRWHQGSPMNAGAPVVSYEAAQPRRHTGQFVGSAWRCESSQQRENAVFDSFQDAHKCALTENGCYVIFVCGRSRSEWVNTVIVIMRMPTL